MADDPESRIRYVIEQHTKRKAEEERLKREEKEQYYKNVGQEPPKERSWQEKMYVESDHPNTMENSTATMLYIITMIIGTIFNDRLLIWIAASVIYFGFMSRRKIRQKEWGKKHKK